MVLLFLAQLAVFDLSGLKMVPIAVDPVEADGDPATVEWLITDDTGAYRLGRIAPFCLSGPFHPEGLDPTFAPRQTYRVVRVGTRDKLFRFDPVALTITIYDLPSDCHP